MALHKPTVFLLIEAPDFYQNNTVKFPACIRDCWNHPVHRCTSILNIGLVMIEKLLIVNFPEIND